MNLTLLFKAPASWSGGERELSRVLTWEFPGLRFTCANTQPGKFEVVIGAGPWTGSVVSKIEALGFQLVEN
jgi:hypothetical protein